MSHEGPGDPPTDRESPVGAPVIRGDPKVTGQRPEEAVGGSPGPSSLIARPFGVCRQKGPVCWYVERTAVQRVAAQAASIGGFGAFLGEVFPDFGTATAVLDSIEMRSIARRAPLVGVVEVAGVRFRRVVVVVSCSRHRFGVPLPIGRTLLTPRAPVIVSRASVYRQSLHLSRTPGDGREDVRTAGECCVGR
jgi:hypothetical protein